MDEFGVLTERFGLKPQGKLAPMASSKRDFQNPQFGINLAQNPNTSQFGSSSHQNPTFDYASGLDDDIFGGNNKLDVDNGGSSDYDSIFPGFVSVSVDNGYVDDIFGGFVSPQKQGVGVDDMLDNIGEFGTENGSDGVSDKAPEFDDLIPGFGDTSDGISGTEVNKPSTPTFTSKIPTVTSLDDPFLVMTSFDNLSLIFGGSPSSEFNEVEGETEERRQARLRHHQRTQERAASALADMNQRDLQTKMEQEERRRIADTVDVHIMQWAAAKEGNMRALLSTLQDVLWPECGWEPVSLTDMIISTSVKKVYRKATLCIHPDKVQQKGANLEQKYTAEKVFDILKAAWNKFKIEELS